MRKTTATHGMSTTPEYHAWINMKQRCYNENKEDYKYYGGRGISVCNRWFTSFENFYADMGDRPCSKHSLDRIDNNCNYKPSNCKWSTVTEQRLNRRQFKSILGEKHIIMNGKGYQVQFTRGGEKLHCGSYKTLDRAIVARDAMLEYML